MTNLKAITTINSPIGILRWPRLLFGINTANSIFQKAMEYLLAIPYLDALSDYNLKRNKTKKKKYLKKLRMNFCIGWKTGALSMNRLIMETLEDPVLSQTLSRIRSNKCSNCSKAERP